MARARALLLSVFLGGVGAGALYGLAAGCSSSHPRDQYYGTDAGDDYRPGMFDAPVDQPPQLDAGTD